MTLEARKIELVQSILRIENPSLLEDLKSMIEEQQSYELSDEHKKVLDERISAHRKTPNLVRSWEDVKAELLG